MNIKFCQHLFLVALVLGCSAGKVHAADSAPLIKWKVVAAHAHDPRAFTQGLLMHEGQLYESTGLRGRSELRAINREDGRVLRRVRLPSKYFGEGLARVGEQLLQLTWQSGVAIVYALNDFQVLHEFNYPGEGWGLSYDGESLLMSDGSAQIRVLDPKDFSERRRFDVYDAGQAVSQLNELEVVRGALYANVWRSDRIARIDMASGQVTGWLDLSGLLGMAAASADVLNGMAWDEENQHLWVTGKLWPRVFVLQVD